MFSKNKEITSFEVITLRESGMRFTLEYEIVCKGEVSVLSRYQVRPIKASYDDKRILEKSVEWQTEDVLLLINSCRISCWDGFDGPHPKNVSDGIMFSFDAVTDDGKEIHAEGSENFPKNYKAFVTAIREKLNGTY